MARALSTADQSAEPQIAASALLHRRRASRVVIAIATFRRPVMLRALLESIRDLDDHPDLYRLRGVVVVDNDAHRSAQDVVDEMAAEYPCEIVYESAPERNIALARNQGVEAALRLGTDFIAFTDDDCVVAADWLKELVATAREYHADAVSGRLLHRFHPGTPSWITRGGFFDVPVPATGTVIKGACSNNALVRAALLRSVHEPFDPRFGISGGSDSLMFIRLRHAGATIVQAERAVVTESVPHSRATFRWIMQRAYRTGNAGVFTYRAALPLLHWLPGRIVKAGGHIVIGAAAALAGSVKGRAGFIRGLRRMALGAGIVGALLGHRYFEYRHVHGE